MSTILLISLCLIVYYFSSRFITNFLLHLFYVYSPHQVNEMVFWLWLPISGEIVMCYELGSIFVQLINKKIENMAQAVRKRYGLR